MMRAVLKGALVASLGLLLVVHLGGIAHAWCWPGCPLCEGMRDLLDNASGSRIDTHPTHIGLSSTSSVTWGQEVELIRVVADASHNGNWVWHDWAEQKHWMVDVSGSLPRQPGDWWIYGSHRVNFQCLNGTGSVQAYSSADEEVNGRMSMPGATAGLGASSPGYDEHVLADHYASAVDLDPEYEHYPFWGRASVETAVRQAFYDLMVPSTSPYVSIGDTKSALFLSSDSTTAKIVHRRQDGSYLELSLEVVQPNFQAAEVVSVRIHSQ